MQISGPKEEIFRLRDLLVKWLSTESDIKNDFGEKWLGNIARKAGLDYGKVPCRSTIEDFSVEIYETKDGNKAIFFSNWTA